MNDFVICVEEDEYDDEMEDEKESDENSLSKIVKFQKFIKKKKKINKCRKIYIVFNGVSYRIRKRRIRFCLGKLMTSLFVLY